MISLLEDKSLLKNKQLVLQENYLISHITEKPCSAPQAEESQVLKKAKTVHKLFFESFYLANRHINQA
tara:strand:+ start:5387 stop:5590 length:204 start_codon:yes stop_codon:yes gene_type:complete